MFFLSRNLKYAYKTQLWRYFTSTTTTMTSKQIPVSSYRGAVQLDIPFSPEAPPLTRAQIPSLLRELVSYFYQELKNSPLPDDITDASLAQLLKSILTKRKPNKTIPDHILHKLDAYQQHYLHAKPVTKPSDIPSFYSLLSQEQQSQLPPSTASFLKRVSVWRGDITTLAADAIVNAANAYMLGCFIPNHACIDNVIHDKAGPRLRTDCQQFMQLQGENEETGKAKITRAYNLPSKYVIHTVGPIVEGGLAPTAQQDEELASCYTECLDITAERPDISSIAFCCISTGVFGFPQMRATDIAIATVKKWFEEQDAQHSTTITHVIFNVFKEADEAFYIAALEKLAGASIPPTPSAGPSLRNNVTTAVDWLKNSDTVLIAAGAGLSAAAGLDYTSQEVFARLFPAMARKGFRCMYEFIGYTDWTPQLQWGYLLYQLYLARYTWPKSDVYEQLKRIATHKKDYFVITSNADGMFVQNEFPAEKVFTPQGDYSHLQCLKPCKPELFPTRTFIDAALPHIDIHDTHEITKPELVPKCKNCGGPVFMNVRGGSWFLESPHATQRTKYLSFINKALTDARTNRKTVAILEIGVGFNTPSVIRWPNESLAQTYPDVVRLIRLNNDRPEFQKGGIDGVNAVGIPLDATPAVRFLSRGLGLSD